jgi:hypothetical protein
LENASPVLRFNFVIDYVGTTGAGGVNILKVTQLFQKMSQKIKKSKKVVLNLIDFNQ